MNMVRQPIPTFFDLDGTPLENGYVYIGETGMDARTNPVQVYLDDALTITIDQPVRTLAGYPAYQGAPTQLFIAETSFTCTVLDKNQVTVFANKEMETFESADFRASLAASGGSNLVGFIRTGTGAVASTVQTVLRRLPVTNGEYGTLQQAIDALSTAGGGTIYLSGETVNLTGPLIVKDNVKIDLGGGTLSFVLSGANDYGVRLRNYAWVENGTITVTRSGTPSSQAGYYAPIVVGPFYGDGGTVASPSVDEGVTGWGARNLSLSTDADGKVGIQVIGGASNGIIENIEVPSNDKMFGIVHLDWGFVGTIDSADIPASRTNFDAGTAYTTHPNNIIIRNIKGGELSRAKSGTDTGSHGIRLSGVYNIRVENVKIEQTTYATIRHTAGDVGFEFAPAAIKPFACKGIVVDGVAVESTTDSWAVYCDSYADNVAAANNTLNISSVVGTFQSGETITGGTSGTTAIIVTVNPSTLLVTGRSGSFTASETITGGTSGATATYNSLVYASPLLDPINLTDIEVNHVTGKGSSGALVTPGLLLIQLRGGRFTDINVSGYAYGCLVDELVYGPQIHGTFHSNRGHGIYIHHGTNEPEDVRILSGTQAYLNGQDAGFSNPCGIAIEGSKRCRVDGALLGDRTSETTQSLGLRVISTNAIDVEVENCYVFNVKSGGKGYSLLTSNDYGYVILFRNNRAASTVSTPIDGVNIIPFGRFMTTGGVSIGHFTCARAALSADTTPTAGTWAAGDTIFHSNPTGAVTGTRCQTAGTPGTWGQF